MIRLATVRKNHGLKAGAMLTLAPLILGARAPDLMYVLFHRPEIFGKAVGIWSESVMRGPSEWSVGERELFAAWVSRKNECRFCESAHTQVASLALGNDVVTAVLEGDHDARITPKARAMLPFLEKLAVNPDALTAADLELPRAEDVSDDAIADAIHVCALFSTMNRVVFATGCAVMEGKQLASTAKMLFTKGYDL